MKYIFFDLDDTIIDTNAVNLAIYKKLRRALNIGASEKKFRMIFRTILKKHMYRFMDYEINNSVGIDPIDYYFIDEYEYGDLLGYKEAVFRELSDAYPDKNIDKDKLESTLYESRYDYNKVMPGMIESISYIKLFAKVGLITNGILEVQKNKIEANMLYNHFDDIFISGEYKKGKPNPSFYNEIIKATGATADESFMIGDNINNDYFGAMSVGMNAIYFSNNEVDLDVVRAKSAHEIIKLVLKDIMK
ncbi:MAG: HAD family hydrolase [Ezakiella sp.]|nr:HAD family hydrolase [Ezakiella sp.]